MSEQNEKSTVSQAASAVRGAIKAGKSIAGASKGAAFGPYGLAAGLAWENRRTIGKIVVAFLALLLLPIIMLMMLPAALFGSDTSGDDASILDEQVAETVVFENLGAILGEYSDACAVVDEVMKDAHRRAIEEISKDLDRYDSDDDINIFDSLDPYDSTRIICEFSALTDFDDKINRKKLKKKLSAHAEDFFSFTKDESPAVRIDTVTDSEGNESTDEVPYTIVNYTVEYVGDDYVTEQIFGLTDEQQQLAADLADSLRLYIEDGGQNGA